jgi:outer membrane murein-binding lipoprotein Lpp
MRSAEQVRARLVIERGRVERLEKEQPERERAVHRAIAADYEASVVTKLRREYDASDRELKEASGVVKVLEAELRDAERREAAERQASLAVEADAKWSRAAEAVRELAAKVKADAPPLLQAWDAAREADQAAREAATLAGRRVDTGDGVWTGTGTLRLVLAQLDALVRGGA